MFIPRIAIKRNLVNDSIHNFLNNSAARLTTSEIQSEYFLMPNAVNFSAKCAYCKGWTNQRKCFRATPPGQLRTHPSTLSGISQSCTKDFSDFDATQK